MIPDNKNHPAASKGVSLVENMFLSLAQQAAGNKSLKEI
jgi:hypothetical protein